MLLRKEAVLLDFFNNYLRLRSTTTPTGKLHGTISKYIYNMIFKAHLITAISSFKGIQAVRIEFFCLY
jgi:hypothetical protein